MANGKNDYERVQREIEERLAELKDQEEKRMALTVVFDDWTQQSAEGNELMRKSLERAQNLVNAQLAEFPAD